MAPKRHRGALWCHFYQLGADEPEYSLRHEHRGYKSAWCRAQVSIEMTRLVHGHDGGWRHPVSSSSLRRVTETDVDRTVFLKGDVATFTAFRFSNSPLLLVLPPVMRCHDLTRQYPEQALQRVKPIKGDHFTFLQHIMNCKHCLETRQNAVSPGHVATSGSSRPDSSTTHPNIVQDTVHGEARLSPPTQGRAKTHATQTKANAQPSQQAQAQAQAPTPSTRPAISPSSPLTHPDQGRDMSALYQVAMKSAMTLCQAPPVMDAAWWRGFSAGVAQAAEIAIAACSLSSGSSHASASPSSCISSLPSSTSPGAPSPGTSVCEAMSPPCSSTPPLAISPSLSSLSSNWTNMVPSRVVCSRHDDTMGSLEDDELSRSTRSRCIVSSGRGPCRCPSQHDLTHAVDYGQRHVHASWHVASTSTVLPSLSSSPSSSVCAPMFCPPAVPTLQETLFAPISMPRAFATSHAAAHDTASSAQLGGTTYPR